LQSSHTSTADRGVCGGNGNYSPRVDAGPNFLTGSATALITFSYYVYDEACRAPRSADEIVFYRWLCSCGQGGYALDAATFRRCVLSHWEAIHGRAAATVVADLRHCTDALLAFVERQILG
jgi:hypothetical protein